MPSPQPRTDICINCNKDMARYCHACMGVWLSRHDQLRDALERVLRYSREHTTRCAFVNRPAGFCTCGLGEFTDEVNKLLTSCREKGN